MKEIFDERITSPNRQELLHAPHGVAIVIFNTKGQVLLGKENHVDKYRPRKLWNITTETWDPTIDKRIKGPVARAIKQELGVGMEMFEVILGSYRETNEIYVETVGYEYTYRCVCLRYNGPENQLFHSQDPSEIREHRWFDRNKLPKSIEFGARLVIEEYRKLLKL